ncbi:hypothetical protein MRY87_06700 [bacterium]|nr:hypothetical protein [bacterium]
MRVMAIGDKRVRCGFGRLFLLSAAFSVGVLSSSATAEPSVPKTPSVEKLLKSVEGLLAKRDYTKALQELEAARGAIEELKNDGLKNFFPDSLEGLKGGEFRLSSALGMTNLEREYEKSEEGDVEKTLTVSLVGGGNSGAFGGIAGLGRMAAIMQQGKESEIKIAGYTANLDESGARPELSLFLESGGILKLEGQGAVKGDELQKIAKTLDVRAIDRYLGAAVPSTAKKK